MKTLYRLGGLVPLLTLTFYLSQFILTSLPLAVYTAYAHDAAEDQP